MFHIVRRTNKSENESFSAGAETLTTLKRGHPQGAAERITGLKNIAEAEHDILFNALSPS